MIRLQHSETDPGSTKHGSSKRSITYRLAVAFLGAAILSLVIAPVVQAVPKRIIILRHGEKAISTTTPSCDIGSYSLCQIGQERSLALQANYLGKGAANSLFPRGTTPAGIFALTLHCLELATPAAQSWGLPLQLYSVVPLYNLSSEDEVLQMNTGTQEAVHSILRDTRWNGKIVVMVWEHKHIANAALEEQFLPEKVTLRQLLHLDKFPNVPTDWNGGNYDYFWIVDYGNPGSVIPTKFTVMKQQQFPAPYDTVPSNDWGTSEDLPPDSGCESTD